MSVSVEVWTNLVRTRIVFEVRYWVVVECFRIGTSRPDAVAAIDSGCWIVVARQRIRTAHLGAHLSWAVCSAVVNRSVQVFEWSRHDVTRLLDPIYTAPFWTGLTVGQQEVEQVLVLYHAVAVEVSDWCACTITTRIGVRIEVERGVIHATFEEARTVIVGSTHSVVRGRCIRTASHFELVAHAVTVYVAQAVAVAVVTHVSEFT